MRTRAPPSDCAAVSGEMRAWRRLIRSERVETGLEVIVLIAGGVGTG